MTGPQGSTGPDSRGWIWTLQPAEANVVEAEPSVKIEAVGFGSGARLTQGNQVLCLLPCFEPLYIDVDADGLQLRVLPRSINLRNVI